MSLITIQEAKEQLHIDDNAHDTWLSIVIPAIENAIVLWVGEETRLYQDDAMMDPQETARLALLVELAYQFRYREGASEMDMTDWFTTGYVLNMSSTALLTPLRKPRIA